MREVVAEADNPVMLYSVGKDSAVDAAPRAQGVPSRAAAVPAAPRRHHVEVPRHVRAARQGRQGRGMELLVYHNPEAMERGINPFDHGALHTDMWKTEGLKQALDNGSSTRPSAARGATRRRAAPRSGSSRSAPQPTAGTRRTSARAVEPLQRPQGQGREHPRVPLSNWTELDIWQYIMKERIEIVPLYMAAPRPTVERDGLLLMVDDERFPLEPGETPEMRSIRFRTLGCYPLTGAVESEAATLARSGAGNAADHHQRAPGPRDRQGRRRRGHGEEEAGGVLLVTTPSALLHRHPELVSGPISRPARSHRFILGRAARSAYLRAPDGRLRWVLKQVQHDGLGIEVRND
jgi:sulfate adenylyltransferase subunit 2